MQVFGGKHEKCKAALSSISDNRSCELDACCGYSIKFLVRKIELYCPEVFEYSPLFGFSVTNKGFYFGTSPPLGSEFCNVVA